jgi:hypothetical protein
MLDHKRHVIAIAPSVFDRFGKMKHANFRFFGSRFGHGAPSSVFCDALARAYSDDLIVLRHVSHVLKYTGFEPFVGVRVRGVRKDFLRLLNSEDHPERKEIANSLELWLDAQQRTGVINFGLESHSFAELERLSLAIVIRNEKFLRRARAIKGLEFFLHRGSTRIPLGSASSGELMHISSIAFIATHIQQNCVIAIDEPETSLHPTWQHNYVRQLLDLFHHYSPSIAICTHAPLVVAGAEMADTPISVYEATGTELVEFQSKSLGLEEMYDRLFGVITPKNHYVSQQAVRFLNEVNAGTLQLRDAENKFEELKARSFDARQKQAIDHFKKLAHKVSEARKK